MDRLDQKIEVVEVAIDDLRANEYNPNQQSVHDFNLLVTSMQGDGFTTPIIANKDGRIIDGEHRWRAAKVLGMVTVPVVYRDYSEAEMRFATIRHNRARGEHDVDMEARVLADLEKVIGTVGIRDELSINAEELAVSMSHLENIPAMHELAQEIIDPIRAGLAEQGLSGDALETVAQRHSLILAKGQMLAQDAVSSHLEANTNYRVEMVFDPTQGDKIKKLLANYPSPKDFILAVCVFAHDRYEDKV